jgi:hypothetical protein
MSGSPNMFVSLQVRSSLAQSILIRYRNRNRNQEHERKEEMRLACFLACGSIQRAVALRRSVWGEYSFRFVKQNNPKKRRHEISCTATPHFQ